VQPKTIPVFCILQFENPVADFDPIQMVKDAITKIKDFFWKGDGTGLLEFELFGNMKLPNLSDILPDFSNPFGGLWDKIEAMDFFKDAKEDWSFGSPIDSIKGVLKRAFRGLFGPEQEGVTGAAGGMIKAGQWAMVGEKGPELVKFKTASQVIPNKGLDFLKNASLMGATGPSAATSQAPILVNNITNAPVSNSTQANTKINTAIGSSDPFTNVAVAY